MKFLMMISVLTLFLFSCSDKAKIEELTKKSEQLNIELTAAKSEYKQLKNDLKRLQGDFDRLKFLSKKLSGIKARLITDLGDIEVKFFPDKAPIHCFNFITRAECGFYDGTQFHRVMPGFMIQGGDPNSKDDNPNDDGQGGPIVNIPHEFNDIKHRPGILSTARVGNAAVGAGSQFFIMHGDAPHLDNQYTVFGEVTKGMNVVNEIATARTYGKQRGAALANHPVKPIRIRRIELFR